MFNCLPNSQICIFPPNFYHAHFICLHFYVGTWRISEGFVWSHATLRSRKAFYLLTANHRKIWTWHDIMQKWRPCTGARQVRGTKGTPQRCLLKEQTAHSPSLSESLKLLQGMWMKVFFLAVSNNTNSILQIQSRSIIIPNPVCH